MLHVHIQSTTNPYNQKLFSVQHPAKSQLFMEPEYSLLCFKSPPD
jgi:hypothetical protein